MIDARTAYTLCMLLATLLATTLIRRQQQTLPIDKLRKFGIAIGGLIGATFFARLPFLLSADPGQGVLVAWLGDGKTVLWGLVGGYLGVELAKWALRITISTGDTFVIPIAIAIAIGRVGCFLYGCCFGLPTDQSWGVRFTNAPDGGAILRHPTQLYELAFHLCAALTAWTAISARNACPHLRGNWMPLYMLAYATYRFTSEFWRPEAPLTGGLTFYQWSSLGIGIGFASLLAWRALLRSQAALDREIS